MCEMRNIPTGNQLYAGVRLSNNSTLFSFDCEVACTRNKYFVSICFVFWSEESITMFAVLSKLTPTLTPLRQTMRSLQITAVNLKARKGTREKARKKKVKVEIQKVGFIPHNMRKNQL